MQKLPWSGLHCAPTYSWPSPRSGLASNARSTLFYRFLRSIYSRKNPFHRWLQRLSSKIRNNLIVTSLIYSTINRTVVVRHTGVHLRAIPWFSGQNEKSLLFESETSSSSSWVSGWKLNRWICLWLSASLHLGVTNVGVTPPGHGIDQG